MTASFFLLLLLFLMLLSILPASINAVELTQDTWDDAVVGKAVFVKFFAPWCGHCKKMKSAWDQLMELFQEDIHKSKGVLVADVDCTSETGKPLCQQFGVRGYPTIKYGDPLDLQPYPNSNGRDFESLKTFALQELKPACLPMNTDACSEEQKQTLAELQSIDASALSEKLASVQGELQEAEATFKTALAQLTQEWESTKKDKTASISMIKGVQLSAESSTTDKKDEL